MSETDYKAFLQGLNDARAAGYSGSFTEFYRQFRNNILATGKPGAKTLQDLALSLGGHGLGSFAPVGRAAQARFGVVHARSQGNMAPGLAGRRQANGSGGSLAPDGLAGGGQVGGPGGALAPGSQAGAAGAMGCKAIMAQATANAALVRRNRMASSGVSYPQAGSGALDGVSFAPTGSAGLGPLARFAARTGGADAGAPLPRSSAEMEAGLLMPKPAGTVLAQDAAQTGQPARTAGKPAYTDIEQALDDYFFRQGRLPPNGGAAFNPLLSPVWAGLKLPG